MGCIEKERNANLTRTPVRSTRKFRGNIKTNITDNRTAWIALISLNGLVAGSRNHDDGLTVSIKIQQFLDYLHNHKLLTRFCLRGKAT